MHGFFANIHKNDEVGGTQKKIEVFTAEYHPLEYRSDQEPCKF